MIKNFLSEYFKTFGGIDEAIVIITAVFLLVIAIVITFVFVWRTDIPSGVVNVLEYLWGGTVGAYVGKHAASTTISFLSNKKINNNQ